MIRKDNDLLDSPAYEATLEREKIIQYLNEKLNLTGTASVQSLTLSYPDVLSFERTVMVKGTISFVIDVNKTGDWIQNLYDEAKTNER